MSQSDKPSPAADVGLTRDGDAAAPIRRDLWRRLWLTMVLSALALAWFLAVPFWKSQVTTIVNIGFPLIACWWCLVPSRHIRQVAPLAPREDAGARSRRIACWSLMLGTLCYALGNVCYYYYVLVDRPAPVPSMADVLYLAIYPFHIVGVLMLATRGTSVVARGRLFFDSLLTVTALATFSWYFLLGPMLLDATGPVLATAFSVAYTVFGLAVFFCVLLIAGRLGDAGRRLVILPLVVGMALNALSDTIWSYQLLHGTYVVGGWLDIGWPLSYLCVGLGARAHLLAPYATQSPATPTAVGRSTRDGNLWHALTPYVLLPFVLGLIIYTHQSRRDDWLHYGVYAGSALLIGMLLVRQVLAIYENAELNSRLTRAIREREALNDELVATARRAGMAEVASSVLHNVGNVLNSINVSATVMRQTVTKSEVESLRRVGDLVAANLNDFGDYVTHDQRGRQLPTFVVELAKVISDEQRTLIAEITHLAQGIEHVQQVIDAQQTHARGSILSEAVDPAQLIEAALTLQAGSFANHDVKIVRRFTPMPGLSLDKHAVLQVLVNLIRNAKDAVKARGGADKTITVGIERTADHCVRFLVTDSGIGIDANHLPRLFEYGFTTKQHGHGVGLYSAANLARKLGGTLTVSSDGSNRGATFVLELPMSIAAAQPTRAAA